MRRVLRWVLGSLIAAVVIGLPTAYWRAGYEESRRLRVVTPGKLYRSGQLTATGFRDAHQRFRVRTVINLQEEGHARDPLIRVSWLDKPSIRESDVCQALGVRYVNLDGGVLDHPGQDPGSRPRVIDDFFEIMDDPANHPVLIHCKAGLHRTGLLVAVYRMEYENRTPAEAVRELRANGFGTFSATDGNAYIDRFILDFERGVRRGKGR